MSVSDTFKTINGISAGVYKEKGSKFISAAYPVSDEAEIKSILEEVRKEHHEAKHHSYAYMLGENGLVWRANDDGEPSGTAGKPILGRIKSHGLTDVLVIVSRYFGGTLLGVSGLINAYKSAAESALANAEIIDHVVLQTFEITFPWAAINDVMKIIKEEKIIQKEHQFNTGCRIVIQFRSSVLDILKARFSRIEGLELRFLSVG